MNDVPKRALLYGGALVAAGGLIAALAARSTDADVATLLNSADVQLRFAYGMPAADKQGQELPARTQMIADAVRNLEAVERLQPGLAVTAEFRGFAHMLRGDCLAAASAYARARDCGDCGDEQRDVLAFNQARMLARAGRGEQALAVFARHGAAIDARWPNQRAVEEAGILAGLGRGAEAERRLEDVLRAEPLDPVAALRAGQQFAALGRLDRAESAFASAAATEPIADYHLGRLKLQQGQVDTAMELLERAAAARPAEVRRLVANEPDAWRAVATDARFQALTSSRPAAPGR
ncbi:MAG: hypothetical protein FJ265_06595 [Planctomycetes bacterium]|nr:hypothetical protein [Planctomycetota bacterium]